MNKINSKSLFSMLGNVGLNVTNAINGIHEKSRAQANEEVEIRPEKALLG